MKIVLASAGWVLFVLICLMAGFSVADFDGLSMNK